MPGIKNTAINKDEAAEAVEYKEEKTSNEEALRTGETKTPDGRVKSNRLRLLSQYLQLQS